MSKKKWSIYTGYIILQSSASYYYMVIIFKNLQDTKSSITKILVKDFWVGLIKLSQKALLLLGRHLGVQVDTVEQNPQFLVSGLPAGHLLTDGVA